MFSIFVNIMVLFCLLRTAIAGEAVGWPQQIFNPQPMADDLVLPMPCGGAMVFRKVEVPVDGWLGDKKIVIGGSDERFQFSENSRFEYVSGSFSESDNSSRRSYFLGKYEVMQMQYKAFDNDCQQPEQKMRLPASGISWFDAVNFAHKYCEWILKNAPLSIPHEDGIPGFIRLPTEAEWEFAARGGLAVSETEFQQKTFPMKDGMQKYVWHQGTKSANGKLQLAGLLKANPLGFHDILGNVDEIALEPFRLNRISRLHGQAGGFIVKGGNYFTNEKDIRSSYRQEIPHFGTDGSNKEVKTVGFRLAISAPLLTSHDRLKNIKDAWQDLPKNQTPNLPSQESLDTGDPIKELDTFKATLTSGKQQTEFQSIVLLLRSNITERNEQRDRATKSMLRLGAFLGQKIRDDEKRLKGIRAIWAARKTAKSSQESVRLFENNLTSTEEIMKDNIGYYADVVVQVAQEYSLENITRQYKKLIAEFENRKLDNLIPFAEQFVNCVSKYQKTGEGDVQNCLSLSYNE